jgi:hypothetical protein
MAEFSSELFSGLRSEGGYGSKQNYCMEGLPARSPFRLPLLVQQVGLMITAEEPVRSLFINPPDAKGPEMPRSP